MHLAILTWFLPSASASNFGLTNNTSSPPTQCTYATLEDALQAAAGMSTPTIYARSGATTTVDVEWVTGQHVTIRNANANCTAFQDSAPFAKLAVRSGANRAFNVYTGATLELRNVEIESTCTARTTARGGLIFATDSNLFFQGVTLKGGCVSRSGGQVFLQRSTLIANDSRFTGGTSDRDGGSIYLEKSTSPSHVTLGNSDIFDSEAARNGGAIAIFGSGASFDAWHSTIHDSSALRGGGIYANVFGGSGTSTVFLPGSEVYQNTARNGAGAYFKGHIQVSGSAPFVSQVEIHDNYATQTGGGLHLLEDAAAPGDPAPSLQDVTVHANHATAVGSQGGGIYGIGENISVVQSRVTDNKSSGTGGGLYLQTSSQYQGPDIVDTHILGNSAIVAGGGVYALGEVRIRRDFSCAPSGPVVTGDELCSVIADNEAPTGAGIYFEWPNGGRLRVTGTMLARNSASHGAAVYATGGRVELHTNLIVNNDALDPDSGWIETAAWNPPSPATEIFMQASTISDDSHYGWPHDEVGGETDYGLYLGTGTVLTADLVASTNRTFLENNSQANLGCSFFDQFYGPGGWSVTQSPVALSPDWRDAFVGFYQLDGSSPLNDPCPGYFSPLWGLGVPDVGSWSTSDPMDANAFQLP